MTESSTKRSSKRTAQKKSTRGADVAPFDPAAGDGVEVEVKSSGVDGAMVEVKSDVAASPAPVGLMNKFLASIEHAVTEHGEGHDPREVEIALYMALMFASARVAQSLNRLDRVQEDVREFLDVSTVADGDGSTSASEVGATATAG